MKPRISPISANTESVSRLQPECFPIRYICQSRTGWKAAKNDGEHWD